MKRLRWQPEDIRAVDGSWKKVRHVQSIGGACKSK